MYLAKIKTKDELSAIVRQDRASGRVVVQCHGCFDILHPGHLRHLSWAKKQGDVLVVSVSADAVVQKGRNRPFVPESLRAEGLAALEVVDYVTVDDGEWAGPILELLRPDVYVKGKEFEDVHDGRFGRERRLVESFGGRVVFSSGDVVYSSTHIIDQHQDQLEPVEEQVQAYCRRHGMSAARLKSLMDAVEGKRVVVVGETIVDTYVYTEPLGMSAEAPVLVVRPREQETFIGGAAIVAQHLGALGAESQLVSFVGNDAAAERVRKHLAARGVMAELFSEPGRATIVKTRYIADGKKVLNVNTFTDQDLSKEAEAELLARLEAVGAEADAVVVTDFGYGVVTQAVIDWAARIHEHRGVPVVGDVQCSTQIGDVRRMKGVTVIAPSEREARLSAWDRTSGVADLGAKLLMDTGNRAVIVTLGARGMMLFDSRGVDAASLSGKHLHEVKQELTIEYLPSLCTLPVDPMGAGDALLASVAACLAAGASITEAGFVAMGAAAVAVGNMGNVPVTRDQVVDVLSRHTSE